MADQEEQPPRDEHAPEGQSSEPETEAEENEDLDIADEEITERVRGGARAISIPF